ncbi:MAG: hypothetical protein IPK69_07985 [Phycisphaerales bacterium]|nr:MAG: hypothetical protein IPK69_07985 [Phycisphaerales bacterium]
MHQEHIGAEFEEGFEFLEELFQFRQAGPLGEGVLGGGDLVDEIVEGCFVVEEFADDVGGGEHDWNIHASCGNARGCGGISASLRARVGIAREMARGLSSLVRM